MLRRALFVVWLTMLAAGCSADPSAGNPANASASSGLDGLFTAGAADAAGAADTADTAKKQPLGKLDVLIVLDNSTSMSQEQLTLAKAMAELQTKLLAQDILDVQVAVIGGQQLQDELGTPVVGRFRHAPAQAYPPNASERRHLPCGADAECQTTHAYTHTQSSPASMCTPASVSVPPAATATNGDALGTWRCVAPPLVKNTSNLNCSINSYCEARCDVTKKDADCELLFGPGTRCKIPGGAVDATEAFCTRPPPTADCPAPEALPTVLAGDDLKYLQCNAHLGVKATTQVRFQGPLRAAWTALDPSGPNCSYDACVSSLLQCCVDGGEWCKNRANPTKCDKDKTDFCEPLKAGGCQSKALIRDDAWLLVVIISDGADCSYADSISPPSAWQQGGETGSSISLDDMKSCDIRGDVNAENEELNEALCEAYRAQKPGLPIVCPADCKKPGARADCDTSVQAWMGQVRAKNAGFSTVKTWVNRFKALKKDPQRLLVRVIAGDAQQADPAVKRKDRIWYYRSRIADVGSGQAPYICAGQRGTSIYGSRLIRFAEAFGPQGSVANLCDGVDIWPSVQRVVQAVQK